ncbi:MAG: ABC transporter ATP-binding protein [Legionellales bacterium]|nr:ABC transporter ATP-binding protein [Legionellales bacterium]
MKKCDDKTSTCDKEELRPIIIATNLFKQYHGSPTQALQGLNLSVKEGEFFGLLGPNGSGKTTTISILCGLISQTSGDVEIAGKHIPGHLNAIKPLIGLVPQDIALYPTLTFVENLRFLGQLYGLPSSLLRERIDQCIEIAGLKNFTKKAIKTFSGGMKRRANLAAGLLHQPRILFLDEPTVNVDPQSRNVIFEILQKLNEKGTTIIYSTHYLEEAQQLCHRVAIIEQGRSLCQDTPQNLINNTAGSRDLGDVFITLTGRHLRD